MLTLQNDLSPGIVDLFLYILSLFIMFRLRDVYKVLLILERVSDHLISLDMPFVPLKCMFKKKLVTL